MIILNKIENCGFKMVHFNMKSAKSSVQLSYTHNPLLLLLLCLFADVYFKAKQITSNEPWKGQIRKSPGQPETLRSNVWLGKADKQVHSVMNPTGSKIVHFVYLLSLTRFVHFTWAVYWINQSLSFILLNHFIIWFTCTKRISAKWYLGSVVLKVGRKFVLFGTTCW